MPLPGFLSYLGLPGDRRLLRQPTMLPHLHNNSRQRKRTNRRENYKDKPGQESHGSGSTRPKRQVQHKPAQHQHNQQSTSTSHHNVTQAAACGNPTTTSTTTEARTGTTSCSTLQAHNQDAYTTATIHSSSDPLTMSHNDDYWVREGHFWKRVHIQTRQEL